MHDQLNASETSIRNLITPVLDKTLAMVLQMDVLAAHIFLLFVGYFWVGAQPQIRIWDPFLCFVQILIFTTDLFFLSFVVYGSPFKSLMMD